MSSAAPSVSLSATTRPASAFRGVATLWLRSGLAWSLVASVVCGAWLLVTLGGSEYYRLPLEARLDSASHRLLRPSGPVGQTLGMVGALLMLMPFIYMARKRLVWLKSAGSLRGWLEVHLFCGIVGPVLVTFHTSFKFNGLVSAAYWSMVLVVLSGFVGRYLYVRIPRSIRGSELTRADLDARAESLDAEIAESIQSMDLLRKVRIVEAAAVPATTDLTIAGLFVGELGLKRRLRRFERELQHAGLGPSLAADVVALTRERAMLLRRTAYLQKTRTLFGLWHVFHLPLVYLLLVIVVAHVATTLYLGYVPFRW